MEEQEEKKVQKKKKEGGFFGFAMIVVGIILLGNEMGWFRWDIPWFPVVIILIGIYLIIEHRI